MWARSYEGWAITLYSVLAAVTLIGLTSAIATASADDRALYSPDELAAIERHATATVHVRADPTNKVADDPKAAALGHFLFFDRHLSIKDDFSCASCHKPQLGFTDGRPVAKALAVETRNTPTLINAAENQWFFWDGRADTQWAQVLQVIENPGEFGGDRLEVAHAIYNDRSVRRAYEAVFDSLPPLSNLKRFPAHARPNAPEGSVAARVWATMSDPDQDAANRIFSNVGKAIAAYERHLVSYGSPFDRYAYALGTGDESGQAQLSLAAKRGLKLFVGRGHCDLCHSGPDFTDGQFHNLGLSVLADEAVDTGRAGGLQSLKVNPFNAAGRYSDKRQGQAAKRLSFLPPAETMLGAFKTPTLRNVARTAPYAHDGRFTALTQVMQFYAEGKAASHSRLVGKREGTLMLVPHFTVSEISDLVAFLRTLNSAPLPEALTAAPAHP